VHPEHLGGHIPFHQARQKELLLASDEAHVERAGSAAQAGRLLDRILEVAEGMASFPERGHAPGALEAPEILGYRQVVVSLPAQPPGP